MMNHLPNKFTKCYIQTVTHSNYKDRVLFL